MRRPLLLAMTVLLSLPAFAGERTWVPIEKRLSAEQLQATGLDTLSASQLALLNQLLSEDRAADLRAADTQRTQDETGLRQKRTPPQAVNATVTGSARAWTRGQTLVLDNGQRWRVVDSGLNFGKTVADPKVTIEPGFMGSWYLRMDNGMPPVKVQRVD